MSENVVELQPYADMLDSPKDMFSHTHKDTHVVALGRSLSLYSRNSKCRKEKKRKRLPAGAFRRQFNEKPSIIPGCPSQQVHS